ncbi:MAG: hypothetical protein IJS07_08165 [Bacteroidales bacterium]|nr:hypothetical protein [Bacteroidales bacterium]
MKRFMIFAGLMLAAFSLTNCERSEFSAMEPSGARRHFTIGATAGMVKTTNSGLQTLWDNGDNLTVFHALAGDTLYVKDGAFKTTESGVAAAMFEGELAEELTPGARYDWYFLNQYRGGLTSPDGTGVSYNVGIPRAVQTDVNSSAHISGQGNYPMFGHIWNAAAEDVLSVWMTHLTSLVKVHVTNASGEKLRVSNVELIAGTDISGTFYVDFTKDEPAFTANATNNYARLAVTGGSTLEPGAEADFFFGVKPFTAKVGDVLELRINGYAKKLVLTEETVFAPGHEKVLNFSYDKPAVDLSGDYMIGGYYDDKLYVAITLPVTPATFDGSNGQNLVLFSKGVRMDGGKIMYDADMSVSEALPAEISDYKFTLAKVTDGPYAGMYTIKNGDDKYLCSSENTGNSIDFKEELDSNSYFDICANGEDAVDGYRIVATMASYRRHFFFNYSNGNYPRFTVFPEENNGNTCAFLIPWGNAEVDPLPRLFDDSITVGASGCENAEYTPKFENFSESNPWEFDVESFTGCVSEAFFFGNVLMYTVPENISTEEAGVGTIVIKLSDPEGYYPDVTATITITQGRRPSRSFVKVTSELDDWTGAYLLVCEEGLAALDGSQTGTALTTGPKVNVAISNGTISATDELQACMVRIEKTTYPGHETDGYSIWNEQKLVQILAKNADVSAATLRFNQNSFNPANAYQTIHYDSTEQSISIYNDSGVEKSMGYWRYDLTNKNFGISSHPQDFAPVQLYKLED